jgi:hypothetical protein
LHVNIPRTHLGPDEILLVEGRIDTGGTKRDIMSIFIEFVCEALGVRKVINSKAYEFTDKFKFEYALPERISNPDEEKSPFLLP